MGSVILLFVITLSVIMFASYREVRQKNLEMLERYVEFYFLDGGAGTEDKPEFVPGEPRTFDGEPSKGDLPPDERADFRLSTFYSVAFADDGTVLRVDDGAKGVYEEDELIGIAEDLLKGGRSTGRLDNLSYMITRRSGCTLVAFLDATVTESSLSVLLRNVLIIGGIAIIVLFFISLFLSKRIIRPLEENDRKQKQFISDASHELKTPVAVVGANAEILSRELGENEWLSNIQYENERMGDLVKRLLDLSRAENTETHMELLDLSRIVTGEVLAFESLAFDRGKTIQSDIAEGIHISGDQTRITQLVSVLLDNALRHSTGDIIDIALKPQGNMAVLDVSNEGDEIPPDKKELLFDRFYRLDEARSDEGHHYGLGLSIAKAVVEKHGGNIGVSCNSGKVDFKVSFPIK